MSIKLRGFISRLQELDVYSGINLPDTPGQKTFSFPQSNKSMYLIYHSMPTKKIYD